VIGLVGFCGLLLAAEQPIPFSHKVHAGAGLKCDDCHTLPGNGREAGLPAESKCMACHVAIKTESPHIARLAAHAREKKPVRWERLYRVADYVFFSHKRHVVKGGAACADCHGPVAERDVLAKEKPTSMKACMDCHEERGATNECNVCHDVR